MNDPPDTHPAAIDPQRLLDQCRVTASRAGGPGGQHRNKVQTAVTIHHTPTNVAATATERRSRAQNHRVALFRLRVNLALQVRRRPPTPYTPSTLWRSRCADGRIRVNPSHDDFPAMLAEALDLAAANRWDAPAAAAALGCTPTQLVKLLKAEPRALQTLNEHRREHGLHPYR